MKKIMTFTAGLVLSGSVLAGNCGTDESSSIVDIAVGDDRFEVLTSAVVAFGLANDLNTNRNFTVFAPTDDAFKEAGFAIESESGDILNPALTDEQLAGVPDILLYHVTYGARDSEEVFAKEQMKMLNKEFVALSTDGGVAMVNDSEVIIPDIEACNGYIHVIDQVLLPPVEEA